MRSVLKHFPNQVNIIDGEYKPLELPKSKKISPQQLKELMDALEYCRDWEDEILTRLNITSLEDIPCDKADYCINYARVINKARYYI